MIGFLYSDVLPRLKAEEGKMPIKDGTFLRDIEVRLDALRKYLQSNEYPCPICQWTNVPQEQRGIITLEWDHECDDMGYKVASWPVFTSTCGDPDREPYTRRGSRLFQYPFMSNTGNGRYPRNHGEQMNRAIEDDTSSTQVDYILGAAQERRRLRELLGIPEPDQYWR